LGLDARLIDDAAALPFPNESFDVVVALEVLEHVIAPLSAADEVKRVLRPGGTFIVTVPNVAYWRRRLELSVGRWNPYGDGFSVSQPWRDPHIRFFTLVSLRNMLLTSGFQVAKVGGHRGSFVRDIPYVAKLFKSPRCSTRLYRYLQAIMPAFLGLHLHAVAIKPGEHSS
jgi:SAM-dependent methyltransferase